MLKKDNICNIRIILYIWDAKKKKNEALYKIYGQLAVQNDGERRT